jgi:hypothetical protein
MWSAEFVDSVVMPLKLISVMEITMPRVKRTTPDTRPREKCSICGGGPFLVHRMAHHNFQAHGIRLGKREIQRRYYTKHRAQRLADNKKWCQENRERRNLRNRQR